VVTAVINSVVNFKSKRVSFGDDGVPAGPAATYNQSTIVLGMHGPRRPPQPVYQVCGNRGSRISGKLMGTDHG
jgi:hypothetical protein